MPNKGCQHFALATFPRRNCRRLQLPGLDLVASNVTDEGLKELAPLNNLARLSPV